MIRNQLIWGISLSFLMINIALAEKPAIDTESGMIIDTNWQLVRSLCSSCHSARQFLQQSLDKSTWEEVIDWMKEQGLPELDSDTRSKIVDYLVKNYSYETKKETAN